jgi:hypothetical protein
MADHVYERTGKKNNELFDNEQIGKLYPQFSNPIFVN